MASVFVVVVAGVATVAAGVLLYDTHLSVSAALGALVALALGGFAWAATATALTAAIPTVEGASPTLPAHLLPRHHVSGIFGIFGSIIEPH